MKIVQLSIILIVNLLLSNCSANKIDIYGRTDSEAIIIGKIILKDNGEDISSNLTYYFSDENLKFINFKVNSKNYFIAKVPIGSYKFDYFVNSDIRAFMADEYIKFTVKESKVYYLGDLVVNAPLIQLPEGNSKKRKASEFKGPYMFTYSAVENNLNDALNYFKQDYPDIELINSPMVVNN